MPFQVEKSPFLCSDITLAPFCVGAPKALMTVTATAGLLTCKTLSTLSPVRLGVPFTLWVFSLTALCCPIQSDETVVLFKSTDTPWLSVKCFALWLALKAQNLTRELHHIICVYVFGGKYLQSDGWIFRDWCKDFRPSDCFCFVLVFCIPNSVWGGIKTISMQKCLNHILIVSKDGFSCRFVWMSYSTPSLTHRDASDNHSLILTKDKILQQIGRLMYKAVLPRKGNVPSIFFCSVAFMGQVRTWGLIVFAYFRFVQRVLCCFCYQRGIF